MNYYQKYIKYKTKYINQKKLNNNIDWNISINNTYYKLTGGRIMSNIKLDTFAATFFNTYNIITWNINKIYSTPENNHEMKEYCKSVSASLENCNPPYPLNFVLEKTPNSCCNLHRKNNTIDALTKTSVHKFDINSLIIKDSINFKLINYYPEIKTQDNKQIYLKYLTKLINDKINESHIGAITALFYDDDDDDDKLKPKSGSKFTVDEIKQILSKNEYKGDMFELLDIVDPIKKYKTDDTLQQLKQLKDLDMKPKYIQTHSNKLFEQNIEDKKILYYYFSFGTLDSIEYVNWSDSLEIYISEIREYLKDPSVKNIVLAGHSVGSIVIQHLAIQLIKNNIDVSKIYVVGSGCRLDNVLNDVDLILFKTTFENRYFFVLTGYIDKENDNIHFDDRHLANKTTTYKMNKINTHMLICNNKTITNITTCKPVIFKIINYDEMIHSGKYIPEPSSELHEFQTYANLYFNLPQEDFSETS